MKLHNDQLIRIRTLVTSLGEVIHVGGDVRVAWDPGHTHYVVTGPGGTRLLNPAHVVSADLA